MTQLETLTKELLAFRNERDWKQFHNAKDLALAISIEAAEINELFLWKSAEEVNIKELRLELADVISYCLLLANELDIDIGEAVEEKIVINGQKYPVEKAKGNTKKYTDL